tara:strand:- start:50 stop:421 length:372 start_codon:yes stop_codon:yes gene_type:complete
VLAHIDVEKFGFVVSDVNDFALGALFIFRVIGHTDLVGAGDYICDWESRVVLGILVDNVNFFFNFVVVYSINQIRIIIGVLKVNFVLSAALVFVYSFSKTTVWAHVIEKLMFGRRYGIVCRSR